MATQHQKVNLEDVKDAAPEELAVADYVAWRADNSH